MVCFQELEVPPQEIKVSLWSHVTKDMSSMIRRKSKLA